MTGVVSTRGLPRDDFLISSLALLIIYDIKISSLVQALPLCIFQRNGYDKKSLHLVFLARS